MAERWHDIITLIASMIFSMLMGSFLMGVFISYYNIEADQTLHYVVNAIITQCLIFGGAVLLYLRIRQYKFRAYIDIRPFNREDILAVFIGFTITIVLMLALSPLLDFIQSSFKEHPWIIYQTEVQDKQNAVIANLRGFKLPLAIFVFAILPAVFEELIFRGILYKVLKELSKKKWVGIGLSAFIFAVVHFQVLSFLPIFLVGILLAIIYERTRNLMAPILFHFLFNAVQVVFW